MTDTNFQLIADADPDDLPRTLKRERAARAHEAREREAREARERETRDREKEARERSGYARDAARDTIGAAEDDGAMYRAEAYLARNPMPAMYGDDPIPAAVRRFDVPFFHLVTFFLKAVVAAVPAIILLGVMLWFGGQALEAQFPELIKMKIMITFPN